MLCSFLSCFRGGQSRAPGLCALEIEADASLASEAALPCAVPEKGDSGEASLNLDVLPLGRPSFDGKVGMVPLPAIAGSTPDPMTSGLASTGWSTMGLMAADMELHPSVLALRAQEKTFRALMDKSGTAAAATLDAHSGGRSARRNVTTPPSTAGSHMDGRLYDPEVSRLNEQLIKACSSAQRPGEHSSSGPSS